MTMHIMEEAKACLQCKSPMCSKGCPINTPIKDIIRMLLEGQIQSAGQMLFENNPLSIICALVCPHEQLCEGHCILKNKQGSVQIGNIEYYISNYMLDMIRANKSKDCLGNIGIIGSGPAGITIAHTLASKGYAVTIFEAHDRIGGVLRYGIPEYRLPKDILDRIRAILENEGVIIRPNTLIGPTLTLDDLIKDGYDAIFIGTGVWNPNKLKIRGESLGNVHFAIDYLKNPEVYNLGNRVCVIGGGNVAIDAARTAVRKGAKEVTIMYRRGEDDMSATKHEINYAKMDGVRFQFYKSPIELKKNAVVYIETVDNKDSEQKKLIKIEGTEGTFPSDSIIVAVSQGPKSNIVSTNRELKVNRYGFVTIDELGKTTMEGVFASGDVVTGVSSVVEAVKHSKEVAEAIHQYCLSKKNA